jgi:amphi-Trp domain-containing protein
LRCELSGFGYLSNPNALYAPNSADSASSSGDAPARASPTPDEGCIAAFGEYPRAARSAESQAFGDRPTLMPAATAANDWSLKVELVELKEKVTMSREDAAARLHAIADELGANNDVVIEREHIRFVAHVPDQVNLKVEFEIEDDGAELEIELTW